MNARSIFQLVLATRKLITEVFLMTLSIKNGGYPLLITLDLMLSMSLEKAFRLLQILNDLSIQHLILSNLI